MKRPVKLTHKRVVELKPVPPSAFDPSMYKPDHFPSPDTDWVRGCRWQTMLWNGQCLGLKFINAGTIKRPGINLEIYSKNKLTSDYIGSLVGEINYRYDFQTDLSGFIEKFKNDEQLGPIHPSTRACRKGTSKICSIFYLTSTQDCCIHRRCEG